MYGSLDRVDAQNAKAKISPNQLSDSYNRLLRAITDTHLDTIGNYKIIRLFGEGSFGKVYLAYHKFTNTKVVLKSAPKSQPHLVREIHHHRQFKHPHIARLYEIIITESLVWMVLEYCAGDELYTHLVKHGRLSVDETRKIFAQLCGAVAYTHAKNCTHRDLKLENILLDKKHNVKLVDFGFTREYQPRALLQTVCGTTCYMAPEMLQGKPYSGQAVDVWSLGVILYTLLYGEMPFEEENDADTKIKVIHHEPQYFSDVLIPDNALGLVRSLLSKDPKQRPLLQEIINHPYLEEYGAVQRTILNTKEPKLFSTKAEKRVVRHLRAAHVDLDRLTDAVISQRCDSLAALWTLMVERERKFESKKHRNSLSIAKYSLGRKDSDKRSTSGKVTPAEKMVQSEKRSSSSFSNLVRLGSSKDAIPTSIESPKSSCSPRSPLSNKVRLRRSNEQEQKYGLEPDTKPDTNPDSKLDRNPDEKLDGKPDAKPDSIKMDSQTDGKTPLPDNSQHVQSVTSSKSASNIPSPPPLESPPLVQKANSAEPLITSTPVKLPVEAMAPLSMKSSGSSFTKSVSSEGKENMRRLKNFMLRFILPVGKRKKIMEQDQAKDAETDKQMAQHNSTAEFPVQHSREQSSDMSSMVEFKRQRPVSQVSQISAFSQLSQLSAASSAPSLGSQYLSGQNLLSQVRRPYYGRRSTSSSISSMHKAHKKSLSKASSNSSISLNSSLHVSRARSPEVDNNRQENFHRPRRVKGRFNESAIFVSPHAHRVRQIRGKSPFNIPIRDRMAKRRHGSKGSVIEEGDEKSQIDNICEDEEDTEDDRGRSL